MYLTTADAPPFACLNRLALFFSTIPLVPKLCLGTPSSRNFVSRSIPVLLWPGVPTNSRPDWCKSEDGGWVMLSDRLDTGE